MYAIVKIQGQQFKIKENDKLYVHRIDAEEGETVKFEEVFLVDNDGKVEVGTPTLENVQVNAKILKHLKGDKVIVFKKKRRKGYKKKNGHRQHFSQIQIESISLSA